MAEPTGLDPDSGPGLGLDPGGTSASTNDATDALCP